MLPRRSAAALAWTLVALLAPALAQADAASEATGAAAVGAYLDLGARHGCAVQHDRTIRCWGAGSSGRLGGGQIDDRLSAPGSAATALAPGTVASVVAGDAHSCALLTNGAIRCWGQNGSGQLGSGTRDNRLDGAGDPLSGTDDASTVDLGGPAAAVSAGGEFTCALMTTGAVRCWGDGGSGDLGSGGTDNLLDGLPGGPSDAASTVPLALGAVAITAGSQHACALLSNGAVSCWGNGGNGRLGTGATDNRLDGMPNAAGADGASIVPLPGPAVAVSAGGSHTCALLAGGAVSCWGYGQYGQLGAGRPDSRLDGVISGSGVNATDVASTVPLKPIGTAANKVATTPSIPAIAVAAGDAHTCVVLLGGDVRCWGLGASGQLGSSATDNRLDQSASSPTDAAARAGGGPGGSGPGLGAPAIGITAGSDDTCAELSTGAVRCWGGGDSGKLGSGAVDSRLDGAVAAASGTDDASLVPIGALPVTLADLSADPAVAVAQAAQAGGAAVAAAQAAAASAAAAAAVKPAPLSAKVSVKGRKVTLAALLEPTKAGACPKTVKATVTQAKKKLGTATLKTTVKGTNCRVAGTVKLRSTPKKKGKGVMVAIGGKGVTARSLAATR